MRADVTMPDLVVRGEGAFTAPAEELDRLKNLQAALAAVREQQKVLAERRVNLEASCVELLTRESIRKKLAALNPAEREYLSRTGG